jgi:hypothetical protein
MKAIQLNKVFFLLLVIVGFTTSCVQDDDYDLPDTSIVDPQLPEGANIVSISSVLGVAGQQDEGEQFTFNETNDFMEGYVISTDEGGNFFREIILQDKAENPEAGIKISLFVNPLFTKYEVGRKIYVSLDGFTVGTSNGVVTLGIPDGNFIDEAPAQFESKIYRTSEIKEIVPLPLSINDFSEEYENLFVRLENVQFLKADVDNNLTFASESFDAFDGERTIESCESSASTIFSTSTFADFSNLTLPTGSGSIEGVLSRTFEGDVFIIAVNSIADVDMEGERCDPEVFNCEGPSGGANIIFEEDFEGYSNFSQVEAAGWENINVVDPAGTKWVLGNFNNDNYAQISGFQSGESDIQTYLISPTINLDNSIEEQLKFDLEVAYANGVILDVLITDNYTGDPTTTEWNQLDVAIPNTPSNSFGGFNTYTANISCIEGDVRVAFFYEGTDPGATTRYHINNFQVNGN